jgi:hypothetical protein
MLAVLGLLLAVAPAGAVERPSSEHKTYFEGSNYELNVYHIHGREDGPTLLIIGGIQGDEPGAFLSADLYSDLSLEKGNLIVVPRANLKSIILAERGADGDMNREFHEKPSGEPMDGVVKRLKKLMGHADLFLHLHDGWGYHYPKWVSKWRNPRRFGQSVITDADSFTCGSGERLDLRGRAKEVLAEVNAKIDKDKHHLHYFNTKTGQADSPFPDMKKTATYYALEEHCLPAFGVESSKHLPSLEMKVRHHNYVINAFMRQMGIVPEQPEVFLAKPRMHFLVVQVNGEPRVLDPGHTLWLEENDKIRVTHVEANYKRGLSCDVAGYGSLNDLNRTFEVSGDTRIICRKDNRDMGRIAVRLNGHHEAADHRVLVVRVNGERRSVLEGQTLPVPADAEIELVTSFGDHNNRLNPVLNFKGWVPPDVRVNDGDDRGHAIALDGGRLWTKYSREGQGRTFPVVAVNGEDKEIARFWIRRR